MDIEESLESVECKAPYIAAFGPSLDELSEFKVVIEKDNVISMPSVDTALHCCFAAYYIYNITYPPELRPYLLFLEQYVYCLKPSLKLPLTVSIIVDSLEKA